MKIFSRRKKSNRFLELLIRQAEFTVEGLEALKMYMKQPDSTIAEKISTIESEEDEVRRILIDELNRTFVDQFHVLPIKEPTEHQNLGILIQAIRYLEGQRGCRFHVDALPAVIDLQRRYAQHLAFPGKAASFLEQLSVKNRKTIKKK